MLQTLHATGPFGITLSSAVSASSRKNSIATFERPPRPVEGKTNADQEEEHHMDRHTVTQTSLIRVTDPNA